MVPITVAINYGELYNWGSFISDALEPYHLLFVPAVRKILSPSWVPEQGLFLRRLAFSIISAHLWTGL